MLENNQTIKIWANDRALSRQLMKNETLYSEDIHVMSALLLETHSKGRPIDKKEFMAIFSMMEFKLDKTLSRLISKGLVVNDINYTGKRGESFKLSLTIAGEQLLIKYEKILKKMINE